MKTIPEPIRDSLARNPLRVLDIGARSGIDKRWAPLRPVAKFLGIEADAKECANLNQKANQNEGFVAYVLAGATGRRKFYICQSPGSSSLYMPNIEFVTPFTYGRHLGVVSEQMLDTVTLDQVCGWTEFAPDIIKIDTQGSELEILEAGRNALASTIFIETEVEFNPIYCGQPLFAEVDQFMRASGFRLLSLKRSIWRYDVGSGRAEGGHLVHGDALYYRIDHTSLDSISKIKLLLTMSLYQQYDFVTFYANKWGINDEIRNYLLPPSPFWTRILGGFVRGHIHHRLRKLVDGLRYRARDWHDADFY